MTAVDLLVYALLAIYVVGVVLALRALIDRNTFADEAAACVLVAIAWPIALFVFLIVAGAAGWRRGHEQERES